MQGLEVLECDCGALGILLFMGVIVGVRGENDNESGNCNTRLWLMNYCLFNECSLGWYVYGYCFSIVLGILDYK